MSQHMIWFRCLRKKVAFARNIGGCISKLQHWTRGGKGRQIIHDNYSEANFFRKHRTSIWESISLYKLSLTLIVFHCKFAISIGFRHFCRGFTVCVTAFTRFSLKTWVAVCILLVLLCDVSHFYKKRCKTSKATHKTITKTCKTNKTTLTKLWILSIHITFFLVLLVLLVLHVSPLVLPLVLLVLHVSL